MHRPLLPISDITPTTKTWTAKVLVAQRLNPRESQSGGKRYHRFFLIDKDEIVIQAIIYDQDIDLMEKLLQLQETYLISNAKVVSVEPKFRIVPHLYQWVISRTIVVSPVTDDALPRELGAPQFTRFADLLPLKGSNTLINILAIVIDRTKRRLVRNQFGDSTMQEFFVINDDEGQVILATPEKMPIIAAIRLDVSHYNGISLLARGSANIVLNPSYPESQSLRHWYEPKFRVRVTAKISDPQQKFWYMACGNCYKSTAAQYLWNITCNVCHAETVAKLRTKFAMTLSDGTTKLEAILFGALAEKYLGLPENDLMKKDEQNEKVDCAAINTRLYGKEFNADIRKKKIQTRYGPENQYTVFGLEEIQQLPVYPLLATLLHHPVDISSEVKHLDVFTRVLQFIMQLLTSRLKAFVNNWFGFRK
ncbi:hypothetical protein BUALT_Bualt09G0002800 [Buddleja alternifolia]|uniref:Replication factor A C-terminal domain-containing protein n=1 Tax=Buddleja alternifolia TaxID=168488 RepID=A0AAV6X043_9LAMI|nr:hypothetical protein BUALT_Bualt09G0002800 [Buddleja alternifolia]